MPNAKKKGVFFAVLVLFAINILNFYDRHVPGALVEPMRREFHLSDMQIGLLGSVFIWLYAIMGVPLGRIADSGSRKKLLAWGLVVWASLTACAAIATNFSILLISRVGVGLGEATCAPAATSWLGDLFPADKRSRVLALFMLGVPFGGALAYFSSGPLAQAHGWRAAMVVAAAPVQRIPFPQSAHRRSACSAFRRCGGSLLPGFFSTLICTPSLYSCRRF